MPKYVNKLLSDQDSELVERYWFVSDVVPGCISLCCSIKGNHTQEVARVLPNGTMQICPLNEDAARSMGLQILSTPNGKEIKLVPTTSLIAEYREKLNSLGVESNDDY